MSRQEKEKNIVDKLQYVYMYIEHKYKGRFYYAQVKILVTF